MLFSLQAWLLLFLPMKPKQGTLSAPACSSVLLLAVPRGAGHSTTSSFTGTSPVSMHLTSPANPRYIQNAPVHSSLTHHPVRCLGPTDMNPTCTLQLFKMQTVYATRADLQWRWWGLRPGLRIESSLQLTIDVKPAQVNHLWTSVLFKDDNTVSTSYGSSEDYVNQYREKP